MAINTDLMKEEALVKQAKAGDNLAFSELYDFYIKKIYDFVYYKTMNKESAEDIVSSVFLKAWRNLNKYKGGNFSAWLYKIARNTVIDFYRKQKTHKDIEDCWDLASDDDLVEKADTTLKIDNIKSVMSQLKAEEREVIFMRFWLDMPFEEIAEKIGKKEGAVKMCLARSLKKIRIDLLLMLLSLSPQLLNNSDIWRKIN